ncbi:hypothetical protein F0562_007346 [Nyssa sinensis]|uniref:Uncharacterized protein n=1 Tax=Nyssa sinensis TaxID=561372 RepID=A0A5J5A7T5_9ASTE|nr:hypothetical protein F0562_007346 [Nyssa sinensis]
MDLPHTLTSIVSVLGTFKFIPRALTAVHRQAAASESGKSLSEVQHLLKGGDPATRFCNPPRRSAQVPSFDVSIGQNGFTGGAFGGGTGGSGLGMHELQALENVEKKRRQKIRVAAESFLVVITRLVVGRPIKSSSWAKLDHCRPYPE